MFSNVDGGSSSRCTKPPTISAPESIQETKGVFDQADSPVNLSAENACKHQVIRSPALLVPRSKSVSRSLSFSDSVWRHETDFRLESGSQNDFPNPLDQEESLTHRPSTRIFTRSQKRLLVTLVSLGAIFSPLSSNIYFPALPTISADLHIAQTLATLSISSYLIAQGIAPSFWGPLSDSIGRRPVFLCTFVVYLLANVGLGLSRSFTTLMIFRALQAAGSSATIALGSGVIGDISEQSERGGLMGYFGGGRFISSFSTEYVECAFGPVLGGILSEYLGFRSIFWFLVIAAGAVTILLYTLLPETHPRYEQKATETHSPTYQIGWNLAKSWHRRDGKNRSVVSQKDPQPKSRFSLATFQFQFAILCEKDILVTLLFGAVIYTVWSMVTASTSTLFKEEYKLDNVRTGLIFIPNGLGCIVGSYAMGILMDRTYKVADQRYRLSNGLPSHLDEYKLSQAQADDFPLEKARMYPMWYIVPLFVCSVAGYGWTLESHIAVPLTLQFVIAFTAAAVFSINSTMTIDLYPSRPASATAANNLLRCSLGAIGVGVVEKLQTTYKERILFTGLAVFTCLSCSLLVMEWRYGQKWRVDRSLKAKKLTK